jgi:hypothetical protein
MRAGGANNGEDEEVRVSRMELLLMNDGVVVLMNYGLWRREDF